MSDTENLKNTLFRKAKTGWEGIDDAKKQEIFNYCKNYM